MNCPSRTDEPPESDGWNQSPPDLSGDLTTRQDFNGLVNSRELRDSSSSECAAEMSQENEVDERRVKDRPPSAALPTSLDGGDMNPTDDGRAASLCQHHTSLHASSNPTEFTSPYSKALTAAQEALNIVVKFGKFIGPGLMVAVAYIDPGNYSTDVSAGAATRFRLLFIVFMSNVFAILLQSLAVRLGTVTGLNLAEHCRAHLPRWLNLVLYILGEAAIIATDIAEVCHVYEC